MYRAKELVDRMESVISTSSALGRHQQSSDASWRPQLRDARQGSRPDADAAGPAPGR